MGDVLREISSKSWRVSALKDMQRQWKGNRSKRRKGILHLQLLIMREKKEGDERAT